MHIIVWIIFGLIVGVVAKFLMPGRDPGGFIMAVVGAVIVLFVYRLVARRTT